MEADDASVRSPLVSLLNTIMGPPDTDNLKAFFEIYEGAFFDVPHDVQALAGSIIVKEWKSVGKWPTPAQALEYCARARRSLKTMAVGLEPIDDFDVWHAGILAEIRKAEKESEIAAALGRIAPYVEARWCFPSRLRQAESVGAERAKELRAKHSRNPAGADL